MHPNVQDSDCFLSLSPFLRSPFLNDDPIKATRTHKLPMLINEWDPNETSTVKLKGSTHKHAEKVRLCLHSYLLCISTLQIHIDTQTDRQTHKHTLSLYLSHSLTLSASVPYARHWIDATRVLRS